MKLGLERRVVLVTGASSGIGRATAVGFGEEGAKVALTYHSNLSGAQESAERVGAAGAEAMVVPLDLGDEGSIRAAVDAVVERWGGIDVLVNNAVEWGSPAPPWDAPLFEELPAEQWQRMLRTSVEGVFHTVQAVLPSMRRRGWGRIVMLSSDRAEQGMAGAEAYGAAKAALHGLSRSLARGLGPAGILVNVVMPGLTITERNSRVIPERVREAVAGESASGRLSTPENVAAAVVFLASAANGNATGEIFRVTGGM